MDHKQTRKKVGKDEKGKERYVLYPFRSLTNYKAMHRKRAEKMEVLQEFLAAPTLTRARKIVFP
jgi:hypothetical protein